MPLSWLGSIRRDVSLLATAATGMEVAVLRPLPARHAVGFRRDGRPIYPIVGASPEDETDDHLDGTGAGDGGRVPQVRATQDRLGKTGGITRPRADGRATVPAWWQRAEDRRS
jgi:hypothetical protein